MRRHRKCSIPWCRVMESQSFHEFPSDHSIRQKWLDNISEIYLGPLKIHQYSTICNLHFEAHCFKVASSGKKCLKRDAVPTIFMQMSSLKCTDDGLLHWLPCPYCSVSKRNSKELKAHINQNHSNVQQIKKIKKKDLKPQPNPIVEKDPLELSPADYLELAQKRPLRVISPTAFFVKCEPNIHEIKMPTTKALSCIKCHYKSQSEERFELHQRTCCTDSSNSNNSTIINLKTFESTNFECPKCFFVTTHEDNLKHHFYASHFEHGGLEMVMWTCKKCLDNYFTCSGCMAQYKRIMIAQHIEMDHTQFQDDSNGEDVEIIDPALQDHLYTFQLLWRNKENSNTIIEFQCTNCEYRTETMVGIRKHFYNKHIIVTQGRRISCNKCVAWNRSKNKPLLE